MRTKERLAPLVERFVAGKEPLLWLNHARQSVSQLREDPDLNLMHVYDADRRLNQFAGLLVTLFPELSASHGIIESRLCSATRLQTAMMGESPAVGRWFIKADHALPVAGSIKARGGIYEVLLHAESLALRDGLMSVEHDRRVLASSDAREMFGRYQIAVGSTGNLGLSIGIMAAALGFQAKVHMSSNAKAWKKARLRDHGVTVIEHQGDFGDAVAAGRELARGDPSSYFVDDENSLHLFLGYSAAAIRLRQQLVEEGIKVDAQNPLFVYLPCGVGGAPGGITFGLRHLLGDHVHCFLAEPVTSPCMLVRLTSTDDRPLSVRDVGLDNSTEADGLAVGQASEFVVRNIRSLVSGVFTVPDDHLFEDLYLSARSEQLRIEPSAAAGFRGPNWLLKTQSGHEYLVNHALLEHMKNATHILWTTGGAFVPDEEYQQFHERGRASWTEVGRRKVGAIGGYS